jgi:tetratricopeptide (TPR) repeat protein
MLVFVGIAYAADILFAKARTRVAAGDVEGARDFLLRASSLNPYRDVYLRELSGIFLVQASIAAGEQVRLPQDQRDPSAVQVPVTAAVRAATAARDLAPRQAPNWINLAATYRGVAQFASNSEPFVTVALERAVELEPQSPFLHTELGKSYNQQAQAMLAAVESDATRLSEESQKTLSDLRQKAIAEFRRAQALKQDYLDSFYQEALLAERERNYEQALSIMGNLSQDYPQQLDVTFEYGRMLYNAGRVDDSAVQFQKVISFVPTSANAHYGLGFAYWRRGEFAKAQAEFEAVLKVDPNNVNVQNHLADVRAGRSITSASFVAPEPPALEQQPSSQP